MPQRPSVAALAQAVAGRLGMAREPAGLSVDVTAPDPGPFRGSEDRPSIEALVLGSSRERPPGTHLPSRGPGAGPIGPAWPFQTRVPDKLALAYGDLQADYPEVASHLTGGLRYGPVLGGLADFDEGARRITVSPAAVESGSLTEVLAHELTHLAQRLNQPSSAAWKERYGWDRPYQDRPLENQAFEVGVDAMRRKAAGR